ncbi:hypothetical protein ACFLZL_03270 [Thermodesulfobacteriota bacterium]
MQRTILFVPPQNIGRLKVQYMSNITGRHMFLPFGIDPSIADSNDQALWLFDGRQRTLADRDPQDPPMARRTGDTRGAGGFFWFVFFFVKENEHYRLIHCGSTI